MPSWAVSGIAWWSSWVFAAVPGGSGMAATTSTMLSASARLNVWSATMMPLDLAFWRSTGTDGSAEKLNCRPQIDSFKRR